jgi:NADP-dependent 3-hydroxy acid dehydrogenase YdfG
MLEAKKGHIVSIASMASYLSCSGLVDYAATKAGVLTLHEGTFMQDLRPGQLVCLAHEANTSTHRPQSRTQTSLY